MTGRSGRGGAAVADDAERGVQPGRAVAHLGQPSAVRTDRQRHLVVSAVGVRVGVSGRLGQTDPHRTVEDTVAVPAVVEDRDTEVGFGDVDEPVGAHLELGGVPRARRMRRAGDDTELDVAHRHLAAHVERERHREQVFVVMPVEFHVHEQLGVTGAEFVGDHRT
jgi:hypothetical protein